MTFKSEEIQHQLAWKSTTPNLSLEARQPGLYTGPAGGRRPARSPMFLHESRAEENLLPAIRKEALDFFRTAGISWHDDTGDGRPSNYLMDSMVSCVNCLMPFAHEPVALAALLRPIVPDALRAVPVEDGRVLTFEWLGEGNPLGETSPKRRRGSHATSADAYCLLERADGGRTGILIEWKYTESYLEEEPKHGEFYRPLLEAPDGPIDVARCGGVEALFVDPLYQLARLQLLARAMETMSVEEEILVLVIVPENNLAYRICLGSPIEQYWSSLLRLPERFTLTSFGQLMRSFTGNVDGLQEVQSRYAREVEHL